MRRPLCLACLAFVVTIMLVLIISTPPSGENTITEGEWLQVEGTVYQKEQKEDILYVYIRNIKFFNKQFKSDNSNQNPQTNQINFPDTKQEGIQCILSREQEPKLGSRILLEGKARHFPEATNEGEFNQRFYWRIQRIDVQIKDAAIIMESGEYNHWQEALYRVRKLCEERYDRYMSKAHASVMKAMLFGNKKEIDSEIKNLYQRNGIAHMLAISGLHISIIGMGFYKLLRKAYIPISVASGISIFVMYHYGIMTGMSSSAGRAIIMFIIQLLAQITKRSYDMLTAMALAAVCIVVEQPLYVFYTGFQLSFGAILGIGLVYPALRHYCQNRFFGALLASVSISLTTMPVILFSYYEIPRFAIFLNIVCIPLMTILVTCGLALLPIGVISGYLGQIGAIPCILILSLYEKICLVTEKLPGHSWIVGKPSLIRIMLFFLALGILAVFYERVTKELAIFLIVMAISILTGRVRDDLLITAIDVGQGDGFCIQNENGNNYLIDAGSSSKKNVGKYQVIPTLKAKGIGELQYIFVSHSDSDHTSAVIELLEQAGDGNGIKINGIVLPGIQQSYQDEGYRELVQIAEEKGVFVSFMKTGDSLKDGKLEFLCLHPGESFVPEGANSYSNVLLVSYGEFEALFTGDVEGNGELALIQQLKKYRTKYEVERGRKGISDKEFQIEWLKVAHHGSKNSTSGEFLEICSPKAAVLSNGKNNSYGHPHKELLQRLEEQNIPYHMTSQEGAITLQTNGKKIKLTKFVENSSKAGH